MKVLQSRSFTTCTSCVNNDNDNNNNKHHFTMFATNTTTNTTKTTTMHVQLCLILVAIAVCCSCPPLLLSAPNAVVAAQAQLLSPPPHQINPNLVLSRFIRPQQQQLPPLTSQQQQQQQQQPQTINIINSKQQQQQQQQQLNNNAYTRSMHVTLTDLKTLIQNKSVSFDRNFKEMLALEKRDLDKMFFDTYGELYRKNSEIFKEMFDNLAQYYSYGSVQLNTAMESFFARLYQKIFQILNSSYKFDQKYLKCATEQLLPLKPFGDIPDQVIKEIKESFIAARTFVQALLTASEVINKISSLEQTSECINLIQTKLLNSTTTAATAAGGGMFQLNQVRHFTADGNGGDQSRKLPPCTPYCSEVMLRCFGKANLDLIDSSWKKFVSLLNELSSKLANDYNIASAIDPLAVQVSDAIMLFQDNGINITSKVYSACGQPPVPSSSSSSSSLLLSSGGSNNAANGASGNQQQEVPLSQEVSKFDSLNAKSRLNSAGLGDHELRRARRELPNGANYQASFGGGSSASSSPRSHSNNKRHQTTQSRSVQQYSGLRHYQQPTADTLNNDAVEAPQTAAAETQSVVRQLPALIANIRESMAALKGFWSSLPAAVCSAKTLQGSSLSVYPQHSTTLGEYMVHSGSRRHQQQQPSNCFMDTISLHNENVDIRYSTEIKVQANALASITAKIERALKGEDIDWSRDLLAPLHSQPLSILPPASVVAPPPSPALATAAAPPTTSLQHPPVSSLVSTLGSSAISPIIEDAIDDSFSEIDPSSGDFDPNDDTENDDSEEGEQVDEQQPSSGKGNQADTFDNGIDQTSTDLLVSGAPTVPPTNLSPNQSSGDGLSLILLPLGLISLFILSLVLFALFVVRYHHYPSSLFSNDRDKKECTVDSNSTTNNSLDIAF